jgi:hypothetical protein
MRSPILHRNGVSHAAIHVIGRRRSFYNIPRTDNPDRFRMEQFNPMRTPSINAHLFKSFDALA